MFCRRCGYALGAGGRCQSCDRRGVVVTGAAAIAVVGGMIASYALVSDYAIRVSSDAVGAIALGASTVAAGIAARRARQAKQAAPTGSLTIDSHTTLNRSNPMAGSFAEAILEAKRVITMQRERLATDAATIQRLETSLAQSQSTSASAEAKAKAEADAAARLRKEFDQQSAARARAESTSREAEALAQQYAEEGQALRAEVEALRATLGEKSAQIDALAEACQSQNVRLPDAADLAALSELVGVLSVETPTSAAQRDAEAIVPSRRRTAA